MERHVSVCLCVSLLCIFCEIAPDAPHYTAPERILNCMSVIENKLMHDGNNSYTHLLSNNFANQWLKVISILYGTAYNQITYCSFHVKCTALYCVFNSVRPFIIFPALFPVDVNWNSANTP